MDSIVSSKMVDIDFKDYKTKARLSVSTFFLVNGFLYANWVARLPELKQFYGVTDSVLGTLLFMVALGAMLCMPLTGWLNRKYGSKPITIIAALLFCCTIPLLTISNHPWIARLIFLLIGAASGAMDVSMNGQGVFAERLWKKPIMSSFHAVFSIGMALGAGSGFLFAHFGVAVSLQLVVLSLLGIAVVIIASGGLIVNNEQHTEISKQKPSLATVLSNGILAISVIAFCGMTGEGSMADWSAIYMNTIVGKSKSFSAIAFFAFGTAMTIGRLFGDHIAQTVGNRKLLMINCCLALCGLALSLIFINVYIVLTGFFLVGLGLSTIVPLAYSAAGNIKGTNPATGIAIASTIGYTGFFIGPPIIGHLSDILGLQAGLCYPLVLFVIMFFLVYRYVK